MPISPETAALLDTRRNTLLELLTLALSYDEIADVMEVPRHVVGNDITVLKKHDRMPEERPTLDYYAKLVLYRDALANRINQAHGYHTNVDAGRCTRIVVVLRESLNIKDVVKTTNLMLKGIAMQRMHKLPKELWRIATIWRIAIGGYEANNGVAHDFYSSRLQPAPFVATFTVHTFEEWFGRWLNHTVVTPMSTVDELAERFVAFIEFRADPGNGFAMVPNTARGWDEQYLRTDIVITETTHELIEQIIGESCTHDVVNMLDMLVPRSGDPGMTLDEIGQAFCLTRERIRQTLNKTFRMFRVQLRKKLHLGASDRGIDITDTAHLLRHHQVRELSDQLHVTTILLAERTELLVSSGVMSREDAKLEGEEVISEDMLAALCRRVDELDLSVRSANCMQAAEIEYVWQIAEKTEAEWLKTKNFGRKSLNEIKEVLLEMAGLTLGLKVPAIVRARFPRP